MSETPVKPETEEIDLLELAKKIWAKRRFIIKYALIGAVAGLVIGFSLPKEYTSSVKMAPEEGKSNKTSNMAGLAALAGFDLSGAGGVDGINLMLYPDVVQSTPFIVELSQIPVQPKKSGKLSLYDYIGTELSSPWWGYIISAPAKVIGWMMSIGQEKEAVGSGINPKALTREQAQVLEGLSKRINISVDKKTGVITASSTMQDPVVAAAVTDSMVRKLEEYMGDYRTEKAKRDLAFTQESIPVGPRELPRNPTPLCILYGCYPECSPPIGKGRAGAASQRADPCLRRIQPTGPTARNGQTQSAGTNPVRHDHRTGRSADPQIEHQQSRYFNRVYIFGSFCRFRHCGRKRPVFQKGKSG